MSETAYLTWKLRNERVISRDRAPATEEEIINEWKFTINQRLQVDIILAIRPRKGEHPALAPHLVITTWSKTLENEHKLPANWLQEPRVLVGSHAFTQTHPRRHSQGIGWRRSPTLPSGCEQHISLGGVTTPNGTKVPTLQIGWANLLLIASDYYPPPLLQTNLVLGQTNISRPILNRSLRFMAPHEHQ
jgi:hypothetical protein